MRTGGAVQVFPLLFELPAPAQNIEGLPDPGDQTGIFHEAGLAIHTFGIGLAVGEPAIQAKPMILLFTAQSNRFFFWLIHGSGDRREPGTTPVAPDSLAK